MADKPQYAIVARPKNYWMSARAVSITRNALNEANRIQASTASGALIFVYFDEYQKIDDRETFGYDAGHNFKSWPLTVYPTYFGTYEAVHVHVAIPRTEAVGQQAMFVYPTVILDVEGYEVEAVPMQDDEGNYIDEKGDIVTDPTKAATAYVRKKNGDIDADPIGSQEYYYIYLHGMLTGSGSAGTTFREWNPMYDTGRLNTDETWGEVITLEQLAREMKKKVDVEWFQRIFTIHGTDGKRVPTEYDDDGKPIEWETDDDGNYIYEGQKYDPQTGKLIRRDIKPNDMDHEITDTESMFGTWTEQFLSTLGKGSGSGGGGGGDPLEWPLLNINTQAMPGPSDIGGPKTGDAIVYDSTLNGGAGGFKWGKMGGGLSGLHIFDGATEIQPTISGDSYTYRLSDNFLSLRSNTTQNVQSPLLLTGNVAITGANLAITNGTLTIASRPQGFAAGDNDVLTKKETETLFDGKYVTVAFFQSLFELHQGDANNTLIPTNTDLSDYTPSQKALFNIKSLFGTWTEQYLSALGIGSDGSSGGVAYLSLLEDVNVGTLSPTDNGKALVYDGTLGKWVKGSAGMDETQLTTFLSSYTGFDQRYLRDLSDYYWWGRQMGANNRVVGDMSDVGNISFQATGKNIGGVAFFDTEHTRLGIGAAPGAYKLDVSGDTRLNGNVELSTAPNTYIQIGTIRIGYDSVNDALEIYKLSGSSHAAGNLYARGFVSSLGTGSTGGAGGLDLELMWDSLTNAQPTDAYANTNIAVAHLGNVTFALTGTVNGTSFSYNGTSAVDLGEIVSGTDLSDYWWWGAKVVNNRREGDMTNVGSITVTAADYGKKAITGFHNISLYHNGETNGNGGHLDFLWNNASAYTSRIIEGASTRLDVNDVIFAFRPNTSSQYKGCVGIGTATPGYTLTVNGYTFTNRLYLAAGIYLEYDSTNNGVHLVGTNASGVPVGFYAPGYVSSLGVGSNGGAGGIDLDDMWAALGGTYQTNEQISASHLNSVTFALTGTVNGTPFSYTGKSAVNLGEIGGGGSTSNLTALTVSDGTTAALTYNPKDAQPKTLAVSGEKVNNTALVTVTANSTAASLTIGLASNYGDTKSPYAAKSAHYVLAGPTTGTDTPAFRQLAPSDISDLSLSNGVITIGANNTITPLTDAKIKADYEWWGAKIDATTKKREGDMSNVGNISFQASGKNIGGVAYFDTINTRLGIGAAPGNYTLDVTGNVHASLTSWFPAIELFGELANDSVRYPYIDFHYNQSSGDYTTRIIEQEVKTSGNAHDHYYLAVQSSSGKTGLVVGTSTHNDYIKIGGATIYWDATNQALHIDKGVYSDTYVSALGTGSGGSGGGGGTLYGLSLTNTTLSLVPDGQQTSQDLSGAIGMYLASSSYITGLTVNGLSDGISVSGHTININNVVRKVKVNGKEYSPYQNGMVNLGTISGSVESDILVSLNNSATQLSAGALSYNGSSWSFGSYIPINGSSNITGDLYPAPNLTTLWLGNNGQRWEYVYANNMIGSENITMGGNISASGTVSGRFVVAGESLKATTIYSSSNGDMTIQGSLSSGDLSLCAGGGNVGVGSSANSNYKLYINGDTKIAETLDINGFSISKNQGSYSIGANTDTWVVGDWYGSFIPDSDQRDKDFVQNTELSLEDVARAPIIEFTWRDKRDNRIHLGTYAQYWEYRLTGAIVTKSNGHLAMDYGATALAAAVMTARTVLTHEEQIAALTGRLDAVEQENKAIKAENAWLRQEIEQLKAA